MNIFWTFLQRQSEAITWPLQRLEAETWKFVVQRYLFTELGLASAVVENISMSATRHWVLRRSKTVSGTNHLPYLWIGSKFYRPGRGPTSPEAYKVDQDAVGLIATTGNLKPQAVDYCDVSGRVSA